MFSLLACLLDDNTEVWLNKLKGDADHGKVLELFSKDPLVRTGWDITGIPRFLLIDKDFKIISASAPRPSEKRCDYLVVGKSIINKGWYEKIIYVLVVLVFKRERVSCRRF